jgi:hypothetical protein
LTVTEWKPYLRGRLIRELADDVYVIVPEGVAQPVPLACAVCTALYRDREDEAAHREFACCHLCAMRWAHARRKEWADGWRPSPDEVAADLASRAPLAFVLNVG